MVYMYVYVWVCICVYVYVCACVCVGVRRVGVGPANPSLLLRHIVMKRKQGGEGERGHHCSDEAWYD